jgi:protoporphyrinogen oxidase
VVLLSCKPEITFRIFPQNTYNNGPGIPNLEYKLNTEVSQIKYPQDPSTKVIVTCKDDSSYTADNVIVTVSLGVLKERYVKYIELAFTLTL